MKPVLTWEKVGWDEFQVMTIQIVENLLPGLVLDKYLSKGSAQEGIDLIQRSRTDGSRITIQCKMEKSLSVSDIEAIGREFLSNEKSRTSTEFYLVTTASLRSKKLNAALQKSQKELRKLRNVHFHWWDRECVENHLRSMHSIVAKYFGLIEATEFCNQEKLVVRLPFDPSAGAIPRKMGRAVQAKTIHEAFWLRPEDHAVSLVELLMADRLKTHLVCLVAEPYQGKTTYLQHCAWELRNGGRHVQPIYLDVKDSNVQAIKELLDQRYRGWDAIPFKDIVVFIDGLDEAPADGLIRLGRFIADFSKAYPSISIVVSCRTPFYEHYYLKDTLGAFPVYQLLGLEMAAIEQFLADRLGDRAGDFVAAVKRRQFLHWLYHPFYLGNLVDRYDKTNSLPASKLEIIDEFIERAERQTDKRIVLNGTRLGRQSYHFAQVIKKLAIVMQLRGKNVLDHAEFQPLFDEQETELLMHNGLVTFHQDHWMFTNAFFQEHLAASYLTGRNLPEIIGRIAAGPSVRKIRTRWLQTTFSLLSLLEKGSEKYEGILAFIRADSVELLFQTEPSLHDNEFKMSALHDLMAYLAGNNIWPVMTATETIGLFLSGVREAPPFLISVMGDERSPVLIRRVASHILAGMPELGGWEDLILQTVHDRMGMVKEVYEAADLVRLLSAHRLGTATDIRRMLETGQFHGDHVFRDSVYQWIMALGLTREFWSYGTDGIAVMLNGSNPSLQSGSGTLLQNFLLSFEHRGQLYPLFRAISDPAWANSHRYEASKKDGFLSRLLRKCVALYGRDRLTIFPMIAFLRVAGRNYLRQDQGALQEFLGEVKCNRLLILGIGEEIFSEDNWELGKLVTPDTFDFILWEFEEGNVDEHKLRHLAAGMDTAEAATASFRELAFGATASPNLGPMDTEYIRRMQDIEQKRRKNDLTGIQSLAAFRRAVKAVFRSHGGQIISVYDLHRDQLKDVRGVDGHFTTQFIRDCWMGGGDTVSLEDCLRLLADEEDFEYFRARAIQEYPYSGNTVDAALIPILRAYYDKTLAGCRFENACSVSNGQLIVRHREKLMADLFMKYGFPTSQQSLVDLLWMDDGGIPEPAKFSARQPDLLRDKIMAALDSQKKSLRQAVLAHLRTGISWESVLLSHLALCQELNIAEAKPLILDILNGAHLREEKREKAVDVYLALGGSKKDIAPLLKTAEEGNSFWQFLMKLLADEFPTEVIEAGIRFLARASLYDFVEIQVAYLLVRLGRIEGLQFMVDVLTRKPNRGMILHDEVSIKGFDTASALSRLQEVMYLAVDSAYTSIRPPENPAAVLMGWLGALADKSEADLLLVLDFLRRMEEVWATRHPAGAKGLRWHAIKMCDRFRAAQYGNLSVDAIRSFLNGTSGLPTESLAERMVSYSSAG